MHWKTSRTALFWFALVAGGLVWMCIAYNKWQKENSVAGVPALIETSAEVLSVDKLAGFLEGCGLRVHRMSDQSLQKIRASGLSFFDGASVGRDGGKYFRYGSWKGTPASQGDNLLRGLRCVSPSPSNPIEGVVFKAIQQAAGRPGSYFAVGYEYDILVMAQLGIVIVSLSG